MRQLKIYHILILGLSLVFFQSACSTMYQASNFDKIKINMSKDDVLEIAGSPNRSERFEGKDKWAYRFYTDDDKNQWDYRQVTFVDGKVVSAGVDTDELNHLKNMEADDKAREERRKSFKLGADPLTTPANATDGTGASSIQKDAVPENRVPTESDFVEVKGKHAPVEGDSEK